MGGRSAWVFTFRIEQQRSQTWFLSSDNNQRITPPFGGEFWVDQATGMLLRMRFAAHGIPPTFPTQNVEILTGYANSAFDCGTTFLLPTDANVASVYNGIPTRNIEQFRGCHKFRAKAHMVLQPN
ncbi:MAG TPA: hypothetical protein VFE61_32875 [Candidatus Sulfotelmatobacter sp.]|nr:hypothetical protein [Candidatus Sulfotelmatobacter sp.]